MAIRVHCTDGYFWLSPRLFGTLTRHSDYCNQFLSNRVRWGKETEKGTLDLTKFSVSRNVLRVLLGERQVPVELDLVTLLQVCSMLLVPQQYVTFILKYLYPRNFLEDTYVPALYFLMFEETGLHNVASYILEEIGMNQVGGIPGLGQSKNYYEFRKRLRSAVRSQDRFDNLDSTYSRAFKQSRILTSCGCLRCQNKYKLEANRLREIRQSVHALYNLKRWTKMVNKTPHLVCPVCFPFKETHDLGELDR